MAEAMAARRPAQGPDWRRLGSARLYALVDQGAQGVANILAMALLGRHLPVAQFGAIGTAIGIYYFVAGFHRSGVVLPYITEADGALSRAERHREHSDWWWLSVVVSLMLAAALVLLAGGVMLVARVWPAWGWAGMPLLLGALVTPPLLAAEQGRRWLYKRGRADLVALAAVAYAGAMLVGAVIAPMWRADAQGAALAWVLGGAAGAAVALAAVAPAAPVWRRSLACFARHRRFALWLSLTNIPYAIYSSATVVVLIGVIDGPLAAAVFTAARTVTNPAVSLVSAVDSIDKPRAAQALASGGVAALRRTVAGTRWLLVALTGAWLGGVALGAGPLLDVVFHHRYAGISGEVRVLALAIFLFCLNQPSETLLIVLRASATLFATRCVTAVLTVALLVLGSGHGVAGMAAGLAIAQAVNLALLYLAERWVAAKGGGA